jgi:hypothetical protein
MKTNTTIVLIALMIIGSITAFVLMPEGRVVEYRLDTNNGRYGSGGMRIQVVIENGIDSYIPCDALSIKEVTAMCDSLNRKLNRSK